MCDLLNGACVACMVKIMQVSTVKFNLSYHKVFDVYAVIFW